jgi:hypothetical protein
MDSNTRTSIAMALSIIAVHFAMREAVFERASVRKQKVLFSPTYLVRGVFWLGIPSMLYATYRVSFEMRSPRDWFYPIVFFLLAALIFVSYPGTISLNEQGIVLRRYLGLKVTRIDWNAVESAYSSEVNKTISVYAHDGTAIVHTRFHVDPSRFQFELKKRLKVPFTLR